ncbi:hypothetical protein [Anabaena sp. CCY 9910]|uniref:hypothetical protein n=1 Tax=Anabaena sp. CCY 9910 TaxID=3103870 RepID=UPI0039E11CE1
MIDALILRNDVFAILEDLLGTYTFDGGSTDKAIASLPDPDSGWNYPPQGTKVSGLEVVIKSPYPETKSNLGGDRTHSYTWEIHLKQWDTRSTLEGAIFLLTNELPASYLIERVSKIPPNNQLLTVEQCKIFIKEWTVTSN